MPATPTPRTERVSKSWTIRKDLAEKVEAEADARVVGQGLLVEKALEAYLAALPPINVETAVPTPPPAPSVE